MSLQGNSYSYIDTY